MMISYTQIINKVNLIKLLYILIFYYISDFLCITTLNVTILKLRKYNDRSSKTISLGSWSCSLVVWLYTLKKHYVAGHWRNEDSNSQSSITRI